MQGNFNPIDEFDLQWHETTVGQSLLATEQEFLDTYLQQMFGYHLLHIAHGDYYFDLSKSPIHHQMLLSSNKANTRRTAMHAYVDELPLATHSVDVVILSHVLEFSKDPHLALREACRVVIPDGHLVIFGFNPYSLWGMWRLFSSKDKFLRGSQFIPPNKIQTWLSAYDFVELHRRSFYYQPPIEYAEQSLQKNFFDSVGKRLLPNCGAGYLFIAKKQVAKVTPLYLSWRQRKLKPATKKIIETVSRV